MNIEQEMTDPTRVFSNPGEVIHEQSLTRDQKIKTLRRWEYDARELEVAEEENMGGGPPSVLDEILKALHCLDFHADKEYTPPTKHGSV